MTDYDDRVPEAYRDSIPFSRLRPAQAKAIAAGLLDQTNLVIATPTASGKTLIALFALLAAKRRGKKTIYLAPLKALASEKARDFSSYPVRVALSIGDFDEDDDRLAEADVIVTTPEKLDSLLRHHAPWLPAVGCVVIDEAHLLGDSMRGPTLEIVITILRHTLPSTQLVALSATIQNADELAKWLGARLVTDSWRPVELRERIYVNGEFLDKK
jgi:helicase